MKNREEKCFLRFFKRFLMLFLSIFIFDLCFLCYNELDNNFIPITNKKELTLSLLDTPEMVSFNNRNFMFQENTGYNLFTSKKYAKAIKEEFLLDDPSRTELGLNIELQLHYIAYLMGNSHGMDGAMLGVADRKLDWSAALSEKLARVCQVISLIPFVEL